MCHEIWNKITTQLSTKLGRDFQLLEKRQVYGGDINQSYHISDGHSDFFVKINQASLYPAFQAESASLAALASANCVKVPEVIVCGQTSAHTSGHASGHAFLVLSYHELTSLSAECYYRFGQQLAKLHQWGDEQRYGFTTDNYIGRLAQINTWESDWATFFAEHRLGYQLRLLQDKGVKLVDIDLFIEQIKDKLSEHNPKPSLLHGDLWGGNVSQTNNTPIIYDPACYFGDRECDLAMTELFGGFSQAFYDGYHTTFPLDNGYKSRKLIYNLYHILNHANHFGGHYIGQAERVIGGIK